MKEINDDLLISSTSALLFSARSSAVMGVPCARAVSTRFRSTAKRMTTGSYRTYDR